MALDACWGGIQETTSPCMSPHSPCHNNEAPSSSQMAADTFFSHLGAISRACETDHPIVPALLTNCVQKLNSFTLGLGPESQVSHTGLELTTSSRITQSPILLGSLENRLDVVLPGQTHEGTFG